MINLVYNDNWINTNKHFYIYHGSNQPYHPGPNIDVAIVLEYPKKQHRLFWEMVANDPNKDAYWTNFYNFMLSYMFNVV